MDKYPRQMHDKMRVLTDLIDDPTPVVDEQHKTTLALANEYSEEAKEYARTYGQFTGLSLGYKGLDRLTGSFLPGEILIIGGGTGNGKSVLAQNIAYQLAMAGKMTLFITLEMTKEQTLSRMYKMCKDEDEEETLGAMVAFQRASAVTDKHVGILMKKASEMGMNLVILDHLHFLPRDTNNIRTEIGRITKHFKECAVEYKIPVIILCHINRGQEKGEKPDLQHLKETSAIEQDADMVGFVYREKGKDMELYFRKNRSRQLNYESITLVQEGWTLTEKGMPW